MLLWIRGIKADHRYIIINELNILFITSRVNQDHITMPGIVHSGLDTGIGLRSIQCYIPGYTKQEAG
jgi:hypothetical protein